MALSRAGEVFINGVVPVFEENSGNSLCNVSRRKRALRSLIRRKRLQLYLKLHTMAFVAHARPEAPKWLRQGEIFDPASRGKSDTHACSLNKGIGCKSRTRNEAGSAAQTKQSGFPKVAVFLKYCFPCRTHPACGENRSFEELSWLREKAEAMRLCEGKSSAHEWISQKTYKPPK